MFRSIPGFLKVIANSSLAAVLALTVLGSSVASADRLSVQQRAEAEMNKGKDYTAAWQIAMRAAFVSAYPKELIAIAKRAQSQMNEGQDYHAAWATTSPATDADHVEAQLARAKGVEDRSQFR